MLIPSLLLTQLSLALTMEHKGSFLHKFLAEIHISSGSNIGQVYKSEREGAKKGKLEWKLNAFVYSHHFILFL